MQIIDDLKGIKQSAEEKADENVVFAERLKGYVSPQIDALVQELNTEVSSKIDCTQCGNCCKSLLIQVETTEVESLSQHLNISVQNFEDTFIEKGSGGIMLINRIPCHFLENTRCSVYERRFSSCREFPALHLPGFTSRLFTIFMHYERCPIIFNVIEALKIKLEFNMPQ